MEIVVIMKGIDLQMLTNSRLLSLSEYGHVAFTVPPVCLSVCLSVCRDGRTDEH
jgi:hypothetical protein